VDNTVRLLRSLTFSSDDPGAPIHPLLTRVFRSHLDRGGHLILTEGSDAAGLWTSGGILLAALENEAGVASGAFLANDRIVTCTMRGAGNFWDSAGTALSEFKDANGGQDLFIRAIGANGDRFATTVNTSGVIEYGPPPEN
jgi:hypothetical protein